MKKIGVLLFVLLMFSCVIVSAQNNTTGNVDKYAEIVGNNLLKFQEFFMGALTFLSFGFFGEGESFEFTQFFFTILIFLLIYGVVDFVPFISSKTKLPFTLAFVLLIFLSTDVREIEVLLAGYEAMWVMITILLPIIILLVFTFRNYEKAYKGESEKGPFYAKLFNFVFLIFFGVFFIRFSSSEEGTVATFRLMSGWILIGIGFAQFVLYKILASFISKAGINMIKEKKRMRAERQENADEKAAAEEELQRKIGY